METLAWILWYVLGMVGSGLWWILSYIASYLLTVPKTLIGLFALYSSVYYLVAWYRNGLVWGWYHAAGLYWENTKNLYPWLWNMGRRVYYHMRAIGAIELPERVAENRPPKVIEKWKTKPLKVRARGWVMLIALGIALDRAFIHWDVLAPLVWR